MGVIRVIKAPNESKPKVLETRLWAGKINDFAHYSCMMRFLWWLIAVLTAVPSAQAQWNIFAENLPPAGSWATYAIGRTDLNPPEQPSEIKLSVAEAGNVNGQPYVWLTVEPVRWLGSSNKAPLHFLVPKDIDRERASKLLQTSAEIVFSDPVKGSWYMLPEDVASLSQTAGYSTESSLVAEKIPKEKVKLGGKTYSCYRLKMDSVTVIDPPFVNKQTITMQGTVWRDDSTPFGVVQVKWIEQTIKGDKANGKQEKIIYLLNQGFDKTPATPFEHGERYTIFRLLFNR